MINDSKFVDVKVYVVNGDDEKEVGGTWCSEVVKKWDLPEEEYNQLRAEMANPF